MQEHREREREKLRRESQRWIEPSFDEFNLRQSQCNAKTLQIITIYESERNVQKYLRQS